MPAVLIRIAFVLLMALCAAPASAQEDGWRHGLSLFGDLKYPPDFERFDYVNPDAPKTGTLRMAAAGTFDSLNPFIIKGVPAVFSSVIYDTLMSASLDEVSTEYGLIAESVSHPADFSSVTFRLRPQARWHDGEPITADDVIFSLETLKANHPRYAAYYKNVVSAKKNGDHEVTFTFDSPGNRELPQIMGQLPILPRHYWEGTGPDGTPRDFSKTTLEPPLGSGPYRIGRVDPGKSITYELVEDYWAKDLPVNVGSNNFAQIRFIYFRDRTIMFEAFKGDEVDVRMNSGTKEWDQQFDFPAVKDGRVIKGAFLTKNAEPMQGFIFNLRRAKFADRRVRQAFNLAYDFETQNRLLSYGDYNKRIDSYFANSELAATGVPEGRELELLEPFRDKLPPELFTEPYSNPVGGSTGNVRANLREATKLLREAGWIVKDGVLTNAKTGEPMRVEFLLSDPAFEDIVLLYKKNLDRLGIETSVRTVDSSQYIQRTDSFDFDITIDVWAQSLSPGNEQREYWGSAAADQPGSRNSMGIKNEVVDALIDKVIFATSREELVAATRALDRVLLWGYYLVPQFYRAETWIAYWDRLSHPDPLPEYSTGFPTIWWWDADKAAKAKGGQ
ncbi:MAG: extracellular solute-binding protein [Flavobacteriaceae bacterium]